ncbi:MAG: hypothetical protein JSU60_03710, partial [Nitrospirota bacterium]
TQAEELKRAYLYFLQQEYRRKLLIITGKRRRIPNAAGGPTSRGDDINSSLEKLGDQLRF